MQLKSGVEKDDQSPRFPSVISFVYPKTQLLVSDRKMSFSTCLAINILVFQSRFPGEKWQLHQISWDSEALRLPCSISTFALRDMCSSLCTLLMTRTFVPPQKAAVVSLPASLAVSRICGTSWNMGWPENAAQLTMHFRIAPGDSVMLWLQRVTAAFL